MNPMNQFNQLVNGVQNPGGLDKPLGFGPQGGGMMGAYGPSFGVNPERDNPNGYTGVTDNNSGVGFHGNQTNFITGDAARALDEQGKKQSTFDPTRGTYQAVTFDPNSVGNLEQAEERQRMAEVRAAWYQHQNGHPVTANGGIVPESDPRHHVQDADWIKNNYFYGHGTNNATQEETPAAQNGGYVEPTEENGGNGNWNNGGNGVVEEPIHSNDVWPTDPPINTGETQSTPFLDAYMRAREASRAEGPVTSSMRKYIEE